MISRRGHARGPPRRFGAGVTGSIGAHTAIGEIGFVAQVIAAVLLPSGRGPHRGSRKASTPSRNHARPSHSTLFRPGSSEC
jgi:hypothetical protein